jgi:hypothetical protein
LSAVSAKIQLQPQSGLAAAVAQLERDLTTASELFNTAAGDDASKQRDACLAAVAAVVRMLDGCGVDLRLAGPLHALAGALNTLGEGGKPALLATDRGKGRPAFSTHQWVQRAVVAAALELRTRELRQSEPRGRDHRQKAAAWVVDRTRSWGIWQARSGAGSKPTPVRTVSDWRRSLNTAPHAEHGRTLFNRYLDPALHLTAEDLLQEAECWGIPGLGL